MVQRSLCHTSIHYTVKRGVQFKIPLYFSLCLFSYPFTGTGPNFTFMNSEGKFQGTSEL